MVLPDHFEGEDVIITFEKEYDSVTDTSYSATTAIKNVEGKVLSWNLGGGGEPSEDVFAFGGKTFNFKKPREKFTLSFEVMLNSTDFQLVNFGSGTANAKIGANNKLIKSTDEAKRWRVIFWFQNSQYFKRSVDKLIVVPSKVQSCYRMICVDCKSVGFDREFAADDYFKGTLNLEFSSADAVGFANLIEQEGLFTGTTATALASMTSDTAPGILSESRGYLTYSATTTPSWTAGTTATRYRRV